MYFFQDWSPLHLRRQLRVPQRRRGRLLAPEGPPHHQAGAVPHGQGGLVGGEGERVEERVTETGKENTR